MGILILLELGVLAAYLYGGIELGYYYVVAYLGSSFQ